MIEKFISVNFHSKTRNLIHLCNEIIYALAEKGYRLTLRQLYYQLVQRNVLVNKQTEYDRLGEIVSQARLSGLIDWDAIEDRTRFIRGVDHHIDPADIVQIAAKAFRLNKWSEQPNRVEVWVEKDALVGVVEKACRPLDVDYFSMRGYGSQTSLYDAARRLSDYVDLGQRVTILHFGDHDPSGIDMTRDITDRLQMLSRGKIDDGDISVDRIALNIDQVRHYKPPNNPAKAKDSRYKDYVRRHGQHCWELDALDVEVIDKLITDKIIALRDDALWDDSVAEEDAHRETLTGCANRWHEVKKFLDKPPKKPRAPRKPKPKKK